MCVLIVEDDSLIREIMVDYLTDYGLPVLSAVDGDAAVAMIDNPPRRFSVLLTDFHMPGSRHGCEVAEHMKTRHPHVHIFLVTGRPDAVRSACKPGLTYDVICKPMGMREVVSRIGHLVKH
jgi:DNA-binding NtrC family response regulator